MVIFRGEKPERCSECELSNAGRCKFNVPTGTIIDGTWILIDIDDYPGCKHCVFGDEVPVLKPIVVFEDGTVVGYQDIKEASMSEDKKKMIATLVKNGYSAAKIAEAMGVPESSVRYVKERIWRRKEESNEQKPISDESKA